MPYIGVSPQFGVRRKHTYTATAGQTSFSGAGSEGATLSYKDSNFVDVYQNGVKLGDADYTSTSGTAIVLAQGASVNDLVEIIVFDAFSAADTVSKADGGTFDGNVTMAGTLDVTGNGTVGGTLAVTGNQTNSGSVTITGDLASSTSGTSNFRAGVNAGDAIASGGDYNVVVGDEAGTALTTGDNNVAVGYEALKTEDAHGNNVAVGYQALKVLDAGADGGNVAVGYQTGVAVTTGTNNTFIGNNAGYSNTDAGYNTAVGDTALYTNTKATHNVAIGHKALYTLNKTSSDATRNTAVGNDAGASITTGYENVFAGRRAGFNHTEGYRNTLLGVQAGAGITTGANNICIGYQSAGYSGQTQITTGGNNITIGNYARPSGSNVGYETIIGYNVGGQGTQTFTFGQGGTDTSISFGGTSWSAPSDERLKENIKDETIGLAFINELRPVTFQWKKANDIPEDMDGYDKDSDDRIMNGKHNHGFIAQEVKAVIDKYDIKDGCNLWQESPKDKRQRLAEGELIPFLVKSVQELSAKVTSLETENKAQATQIDDLISRITALENAE